LKDSYSEALKAKITNPNKISKSNFAHYERSKLDLLKVQVVPKVLGTFQYEYN